MSSVKTKKDRYDCHRKEVCDNKDVYKPKHTHALIICLLEEILEKLNEKCCDEESSSEDINIINQSGVGNVNLGNIANDVTKKKKT